MASTTPIVTLPVLAALLLCSSCTFFGARQKPPRAFHPPPIVYSKLPAQPPPRLPLPDLEIKQTAELPPLPEGLPRLQGPPAAAPPKRPVAVAPKTPPPPTTPEPVPPAPKIGQIYTAEQSREYNRAIDESLDRVRRALQTVSARTLTAEQTQIAESIRTFQRQAESAREQDLVFAVSLARRADLLATDLLNRLR